MPLMLLLPLLTACTGLQRPLHSTAEALEPDELATSASVHSPSSSTRPANSGQTLSATGDSTGRKQNPRPIRSAPGSEHTGLQSQKVTPAHPPFDDTTEDADSALISAADPESPSHATGPALTRRSPTRKSRIPSPTPRRAVLDGLSQTGVIANREMDEISGMAVSRRTPGVLFALNDSGNSPTLYAVDETGRTLRHWPIAARNRDWEDMATIHLHGRDYLVLGDTGDNRQRRRQSQLYLIAEPLLSIPSGTTLTPTRTIGFRYEDGPRNVEAFAITGDTVYLVSKEPLVGNKSQPSRVYTLPWPSRDDTSVQTARYAGSRDSAATGLSAHLAAALVGVDLNHPTALDFDADGRTAYLLTYRHVVRLTRKPRQNWSQALLLQGERILTHGLRQAEALAIKSGEAVWLTSEQVTAPLLALPLNNSPS